jgi:hypothetical protein
VVREGVVVDSAIHLLIWVARSFGAEFPYCPVFAMFGVEEFDERVKRVAVVALGVGAAGAGGRDNYISVRGELLG